MFEYLLQGLGGIGLQLLSELPLTLTYTFWIAALGILLSDIMLSADNAMVISGITSKLPEHQRRAGVLIGAGLAVVLRIGLALCVGIIMGWKGLAMLGGIYLIKVAYDLVKYDAGGDEDRSAAKSFWRAVVTIAVVDLSLSYDNVVAVAALANGTLLLMILGIVLSIPMVIWASFAINRLLQRFPQTKWLGAVFLGGIAGKVIAHDPLMTEVIGADSFALTLILIPFSIFLVLAGAVLSWVGIIEDDFEIRHRPF